MKIACWNVNGIRAASQKGFLEWFKETNADVVCVQETKAHVEQLDESLVHPHGYASVFFSAQKKGYSSVATFSKKEPLSIKIGLDVPEFDFEGRVVTVDYEKVTIVNAYFPNSQDAGARVDYKIRFCNTMLEYCESLRAKGKNVVLCGDYNIAHHPIDLKNPKANEKNAGYLPEERAWMTQFTSKGYIDTFREFEKGPNHYTWWSYRFNARTSNAGWRIDYFCTNPEMRDQLKSSIIQSDVMGSDHCPILMETR